MKAIILAIMILIPIETLAEKIEVGASLEAVESFEISKDTKINDQVIIEETKEELTYIVL